MCNHSHSGSGQPCGFTPCEAYIKLISEKSRLEGRCKGLEEGTDILKVSLAQETRLLQDALARAEKAEADVQKHKGRRDHFEDLLNRSIGHEQEWTQRALKAEAENASLRQELATKDEQIGALRQHHHVAEQAIKDFGKAQVEIERLRQERDALRQSLNDVVERHTRIDALESRHG